MAALLIGLCWSLRHFTLQLFRVCAGYMGDLKLDDLIAVRVFRNGTEQESVHVEQGTVGDAKELLDSNFHQNLCPS